jgi:ubiquinone/menaquinone biosynthesis C-methylase UbiE
MSLDALLDAQNVLSEDLVVQGDAILKDGSVLATYLSQQNRIQWDWQALGVDPGLIEMAAKEAEMWDNWAEGEQIPPYTAKPTLAVWLKKYTALATSMTQAGVELDLRDKRVLDIGGSGKDAVYWLEKKPRSLDQIEVSLRSQVLFLARLEQAGYRREDAGMLRLHTLPAEKLPFRDGCMDFIFSRATIHHCRRPDILDEIVRVLKPGGTLCFIENYRGPLAYKLMLAHRWLLRRDRGSDDPMQHSQLRHLQSLLDGVSKHGGKANLVSTFHEHLHEWSRIGSLARSLCRHLPPHQSGLSVSVTAIKP